jgi:hypothetical protein
MNGIENAQFDLGDARCSLETAIELLGSIDADGQYTQISLDELLSQLRLIKGELDTSYEQLMQLQQQLDS